MARLRRPRIRHRYSIGEWYGIPFESLDANKRSERARIELLVDGLTKTPCPFQKDAECNKKGGVCSLRLFEQAGDTPVIGKGPIITTCPLRFLERDEIFKWVGDVILQTQDPVVLDEIGFLDRLTPTSETEPTAEEGDGDFIGRIDNVLLHPSKSPMDWCALELQAVYFSGRAMKQEFAMLSKFEGETTPFPAAHRRPDWRSSGPKRLLPQLQTKVPTIRTWGKKMGVVVDEAFFGSLVGLEREKHLSNSEIAWFVVGYDLTAEGWRIQRREVVFTRLEASVKALTGGTPLSKEKFEQQLRSKLALRHTGHPLIAALTST